MYGQLSWPVIRVATSSSSACFVRHRGGESNCYSSTGGGLQCNSSRGGLATASKARGGNEGRRELRLKWRVPVSSILN